MAWKRRKAPLLNAIVAMALAISASCGGGTQPTPVTTVVTTVPTTSATTTATSTVLPTTTTSPSTTTSVTTTPTTVPTTTVHHDRSDHDADHRPHNHVGRGVTCRCWWTVYGGGVHADAAIQQL